jgi:hypothetical protein
MPPTVRSKTVTSVRSAPLLVPAGPPPAPPLRACVISADARPNARLVWEAIEERVGSPAGPVSWNWTDAWLNHYGDAVAHQFVVAERHGEPHGIALVTTGVGGGGRAPPPPPGPPARRPRVRGRLRPRTLHLGTAGEPYGTGVFVEGNRLVALPRTRDEFARLLAEHLAADPRWDRLLLDGMPPDDAAALLRRFPRANVTTEECPVADLTGDADILDRLSSSRRKRIKATLKAFGPLQLEWAEDAPTARAFLDELIDLHTASWQRRGEPGAFAAPRFAAFHREAVQRMVPKGEAAIVRITRDDETVGVLYGLIAGRRLLFYQGGLRDYEDNRLRAGQASHVLFMRACQAHGLAEYDFLAPPARYKLELATDARTLVWAEVDRTRWRTRLSQAGRRVRPEG